MLSAGAARSLPSSGISVIVASVSNRIAGDRHGVFQRDANDLGGIDDAGLDQIDIFLAPGVEAFVARSGQHARHHHAAIDGGVLGDLPRRRLKARFRICTPVFSSPSHVASSSGVTASMQRSRASPPPGTTPSATAALVALMASSSASFFAFISDSAGAPTRITATPPTSLASRSCSFSRS